MQCGDGPARGTPGLGGERAPGWGAEADRFPNGWDGRGMGGGDGWDEPMECGGDSERRHGIWIHSRHTTGESANVNVDVGMNVNVNVNV